MKTIKIFLASSGELSEERKEVDMFLSRENKELVKDNIYIELVVWEDLLHSFKGKRIQDYFNQEMLKCDIVIVLFYKNIGHFTWEEFQLAYDKLKEGEKPHYLFVFFKSGDIPIDEIEEGILKIQQLKNEIKKHDQIYCTYRSPEDLKLQIKRQLDLIVRDFRERTAEVQTGDQVKLEEAPCFNFQRLAELATQIIWSQLHRIEIYDKASHPTWKNVRWKTLYTICLPTSPMEEMRHGTQDTLLSAIRSGGQQVAQMIRSQDGKTGEIFLNIDSKVKGQFPVIDLIANDFVNATEQRERFLSVADRISPDYQLVYESILARLFYCETIAYGLIYLQKFLSNEQIKAFLENISDAKLTLIYEILRELLFFNTLRNIDSFLDQPNAQSFELSADKVLDYLFYRSPAGNFIPALDYLNRWQETLNIVILNDDARSASVIANGPYSDRSNYLESYAAFVEQAPGRGLKLFIANYKDLMLAQWKTKAWTLREKEWIRSEVHSEFYYDKFPTNKETLVIKDKIKEEHQVKIWNAINFTEFIADKAQVYSLLKEYKIPTLEPTIKLGLAQDSLDRRRSIIDEIKIAIKDFPYEFTNDKKCVVVKPITGFGGRGAKLLTPQEFTSCDLRTDADYSLYDAVIVQPFYESEGACGLEGYDGRHDVRIYVVGSKPILGMIRALPNGSNQWIASLENIRKYDGTRAYINSAELLKYPEITDLVADVSMALISIEEFKSAPSIFSIDMMWVHYKHNKELRVVELNSKPSQIWTPGDNDGEKMIRQFQEAILDEFASVYDV